MDIQHLSHWNQDCWKMGYWWIVGSFPPEVLAEEQMSSQTFIHCRNNGLQLDQAFGSWRDSKLPAAHFSRMGNFQENCNTPRYHTPQPIPLYSQLWKESRNPESYPVGKGCSGCVPKVWCNNLRKLGHFWAETPEKRGRKNLEWHSKWAKIE